MRLTLVVNRAATGVGPRQRATVAAALAAHHEVTVVDTAGAGDAIALASRAAADGAAVVVSLGGDGTANEAANALAGTATALAPLPGGSTNVYARTVGFPASLGRATAALSAALAAGTRRRVGLGRAGDRRFLFHAGAGFDARVVALVERHGWAKRTAGPLAYAGASLATWLGRAEHPCLEVVVDGEALSGPLALCLKTDPYTYLGPRPLTMVPEAGLDRPLAVVVAHDLGVATWLPALCSALHGGRRLRELPGVSVRTGVAAVDIAMSAADESVPHQADGEYLGAPRTLAIRHEPACLELVVPAR